MILMYHKIYLESSTQWWVDVDNFYRQMCELRCKKVVYLDDYDPNDPEQVVITFDGVYKNVLGFAAPILKDFSYSFELFVTGSYVGKDNSFDVEEPLAEFVSLMDLKELVHGGGRLQWHTKTHLNLREETDERLIEKEFSVPEKFRQLDKKGFKWLAYPYGEFNKQSVKVAKKLFKGAVSSNQGNNRDSFRLNRVTVQNDTSFKKGTIGVVIASYNYGRFLIEAIESVLRQSRPVDKILISDDCSTDNTQEIALEYKKNYPNLIWYERNKKNLGIVKHFNKAVSLINTDYVSILGADNRFRSDYIEKTAEVLDSDDKVAITYTDFAFFDLRAKLAYEMLPQRWRGPIKNDYYYIIAFPEFNYKTKKLLKRRNFMHGSSMFRKIAFEEVGGYKERGGIPEDHSLFLRMVKKGWKAKRVPHPVLEYRQHSRFQTNIQLASWAELNFYKRKSEELQKILNEITSAKTFRVWQAFCRARKRVYNLLGIKRE